MTSLHRCSFLSCLVILILHIHPSMTDNATDQLINKICNKAAQGSPATVQFCVDFFHKHLFTPVTDPKGLAQITVTQTLIEGTNTQKAVKIAKNAAKNPSVTNALNVCDSGYQSLVNTYEDVQFSFTNGDFVGVEDEESKCPKFVQDCQKNVDAILPNIKQENLKMQRLVAISLAAIRALNGVSV